MIRNAVVSLSLLPTTRANPEINGNVRAAVSVAVLNLPEEESELMLATVSINWWGVLVATIAVTVLAGLWFTVVVGRFYGRAAGQAPDAPAPSGALPIVGPLVCNIATVIASAVLISALGIDTLGAALAFGAIVGLGYLVAMTFQIAINPVFARPLFYGLINSPYFLLASLITSASLVLIG
jgi:Protein of unknown function (DUF1761)